MTYLAIFKRIIPFFLTFGVGLLIASFFISIAAPNFNFRRSSGSHKMRECKRVKMENEELRRENSRMKKDLEMLNWHSVDLDSVPPPPDFNIDVPPPPPQVKKLKELKMKTVEVK